LSAIEPIVPHYPLQMLQNVSLVFIDCIWSVFDGI